MRSYTPKVNQHVSYLTAGGKLRPATITGVTSASVVDLRVGRHAETYTAVAKQSADNQSGVWRLANAFDAVLGAIYSLLSEAGDILINEAGTDNIALEN